MITKILLVVILLISLIACKKAEDPYAEYAKYGAFKDIYPLQDSVTVDLKVGDSVAISTNKGTVWIKVQEIFVRCYKGSKDISCPDAGISTKFSLRMNTEMQGFYFGLDDYTRNNYLDRNPLRSCKDFLPVDVYGILKTIGMMNIQFRNIYPNASSESENKTLTAKNGYHVILSFQKRCF